MIGQIGKRTNGRGENARWNHPLYDTWQGMIRRCTNPNAKCFEGYGSRGIKVCDRWLESFWDFVADVGERPSGHTLDRYPNYDGNYEPGNVRWATASEQVRNQGPRKRRATTIYAHDGISDDTAGWAKRLGCRYSRTRKWIVKHGTIAGLQERLEQTAKAPRKRRSE